MNAIQLKEQRSQYLAKAIIACTQRTDKVTPVTRLLELEHNLWTTHRDHTLRDAALAGVEKAAEQMSVNDRKEMIGVVSWVVLHNPAFADFGGRILSLALEKDQAQTVRQAASFPPLFDNLFKTAQDQWEQAILIADRAANTDLDPTVRRYAMSNLVSFSMSTLDKGLPLQDRNKLVSTIAKIAGEDENALTRAVAQNFLVNILDRTKARPDEVAVHLPALRKSIGKSSDEPAREIARAIVRQLNPQTPN